MRLAQTGELSLVEGIRKGFGGRKSKGVIAGIGDDAAVLRPEKGRKLLLSTDMMFEGVHFDLGFVAPHQLGFKLVSVNVSDISAMGGRARAILIGLAAPGRTGGKVIDGIMEGVRQGIGHYGIALVGGDVSSSTGGICLSATIVGYAENPVMRSGAQAGDVIYVTGPLGDASCGLELLKLRGRPVDFDHPPRGPLSWDLAGPLMRRHLLPIARKAPSGRISAMIDLSDGLSLDLHRLCAESGVGAVIEKHLLPVSLALHGAARFMGKKDPYGFVLGGGEDYELLFTSPPGRKPRGAVPIGRITGERGLFITGDRGSRTVLSISGYSHFG